MTLQIVAIKDRALDAFMQPWFVPTTGAAIRAFQDALNDPQQPMNKHPDDYDLWHLGQFDETTGTFHQEPDDRGNKYPRQLALGKQLRNT